MFNRYEPGGHFFAFDDDGNRHRVDIFDELADTSTDGNPNSWTCVGSKLATRGEHVNRLEPRRYQVAKTGLILTSTDPRAM